MKKIGRIAAAAIAAAMSLSMMGVNTYAASSETAYEAMNAIGTGWNLGNTLDCSGSWIKGDVSAYETAWGNPVTTKEMITAVKKAGFNAVRVPVTWDAHIDKNGNIDKKWLDRTREIVDYVISQDMYCILNVHHDGGSDGWLVASNKEYNNNKARFSGLWKNIAVSFKDYGDKLMFESFNEVLDANNNWGTPGKEACEAINSYNSLFVETVRKTGGNNKERNLVLQTYASNGSDKNVMNYFKIPEDTAENHLIVQVHCYDPVGFTSKDATWTKMTDKWGSDADKKALDKYFSTLKGYSDKWGVPIIVGEYGSMDKNNTKDRASHAGYFVSAGEKQGINCFLWDDGGNYKLLDRNNCKWVNDDIVKAITGSAETGNVTGNKSSEKTGGSSKTEKTAALALKATANGSKVTLTWNKVEGADAYRVYVYNAKTGKYKKIATVSGTKKTITGLASGKYKYKVAAVEKKDGKYKNMETSKAASVTVK